MPRGGWPMHSAYRRVRAVHDTAEVDAPFAPPKPSEIGPVAEPAAEGEIVLPVPADAPPMPETHKLGQPSARWPYCDAGAAGCCLGC